MFKYLVSKGPYLQDKKREREISLLHSSVRFLSTLSATNGQRH